jgi:hypothetical protein
MELGIGGPVQPTADVVCRVRKASGGTFKIDLTCILIICRRTRFPRGPIRGGRTRGGSGRIHFAAGLASALLGREVLTYINDL